MFSAYCSQLQADVLLGPADIEALVSEAGGVAIAYRCPCGARGVWRRGAGAHSGGVQTETAGTAPCEPEARAG